VRANTKITLEKKHVFTHVELNWKSVTWCIGVLDITCWHAHCWNYL